MGAGRSKEEQLYQAVQNGNYHLVKSLRRDGASLEWIDRDGRTPLILACSRADLFDMVITLLNLGANINAYRPGTQNGFPLHHAAKRGLEKTVILLISRGVDPLAINDDGETPLDVARARGHTSIVRIIEDRICLFSGYVREVTSGILEVFLAQWLTKRVWVVVLPAEIKQGRAPRYELAIYQSSEVPQPRATVPLWKSDIEEPKWNSSPALVMTERSTSKLDCIAFWTETMPFAETRYKFLPEVDGDIAQLERFYNACKGVYSIGYAPQNALPPPPLPPAAVYPPPQTQPTEAEDAALAMAINASLAEAAASNSGWEEPSGPPESFNGWGPQQAVQHEKPHEKPADYGGWENGGSSSSYAGWGHAAPSSTEQDQVQASPVASATDASAPPLPPEFAPIGLEPVHYPSIDTSPLKVEAATPKLEVKPSVKADANGGTCVVCWDAPAQGVCIPCGHLAGCMDCLLEIKKKRGECPVCRGAMEQVVKVYTV